MPLISNIGRRSLKVRLILAAMYIVLVLGSVTMIYPLLLMISGSAKAEADFSRPTPIPEFLYKDAILYQRYVESKYSTVPGAEIAHQHSIGSWRTIQPPPPLTSQAAEVLNDLRVFRNQPNFPLEWYTLGHTRGDKIIAKNTRAYRRLAQQRYHDDLDAFDLAAQIHYPAWSYVSVPVVEFDQRRFNFPDTPTYRLLYDLKASSPPADWNIVNLDGAFWYTYLAPLWATIESYNAAHNTHYTDYRQVLLSTRPPPAGPERADWEDYVRNNLNIAFIRLAPTLKENFHTFLHRRFKDVSELNHLWNTTYSSIEDVPLLNPDVGATFMSPIDAGRDKSRPYTLRSKVDLAEFMRDKSLCPLDSLSIFGPRQGFEQFLAEHHGIHVHTALPIEQLDYADFQQQKPSLRWEFLKRNYLTVFDYLWSHGHGIRNTIIFCTLTVLTNLLVNPLAAYALSRYRPPSTYKILLFCMCTMAFPAEVTMIPAFLLLKNFPLLHLLLAVLAATLATAVAIRIHPTLSDRAKIIIPLATFVAMMLLPSLFGRTIPTVSLLNTFWALVLPSMANGFSIFLLKGFFDSLPQELYEAAAIDGATEWHKFWLITMSLSKPILAVLALGAFTAAYSEFMMALVIIPDQRMWTLMVWLFQLQTASHPSVVYAGLVIAAIPTLLIFLFCQNLIMRGLVVPVEK